MKSKTIFILLSAVAVVGFLLYISKKPVSPLDYKKEIEDERIEKDRFMQDDSSSPFKQMAEAFKPLKYFPPDPKYKVKASLEEIEDKKIIKLGTSDNLENEYMEFAWAKFNIDGVEQRLLILEITEAGEGHGKLFLSFADVTSARETYGAGRYVELKKIPAMTSVTIDFNKAYNPYCAYNDKFSCPFPPKENILTIPINAGEKSWH